MIRRMANTEVEQDKRNKKARNRGKGSNAHRGHAGGGEGGAEAKRGGEPWWRTWLGEVGDHADGGGYGMHAGIFLAGRHCCWCLLTKEELKEQDYSAT